MPISLNWMWNKDSEAKPYMFDITYTGLIFTTTESGASSVTLFPRTCVISMDFKLDQQLQMQNICKRRKLSYILPNFHWLWSVILTYFSNILALYYTSKKYNNSVKKNVIDTFDISLNRIHVVCFIRKIFIRKWGSDLGKLFGYLPKY